VLRIFVSKKIKYLEVEECCIICTLHHVTWMIKSTMRLILYAACREAIKDAYRVLVQKSEGKIPIGGHQYR
jgi:hypothetical protein